MLKFQPYNAYPFNGSQEQLDLDDEELNIPKSKPIPCKGTKLLGERKFDLKQKNRDQFENWEWDLETLQEVPENILFTTVKSFHYSPEQNPSDFELHLNLGKQLGPFLVPENIIDEVIDQFGLSYYDYVIVSKKPFFTYEDILKEIAKWLSELFILDCNLNADIPIYSNFINLFQKEYHLKSVMIYPDNRVELLIYHKNFPTRFTIDDNDSY